MPCFFYGSLLTYLPLSSMYTVIRCSLSLCSVNVSRGWSSCSQLTSPFLHNGQLVFWLPACSLLGTLLSFTHCSMLNKGHCGISQGDPTWVEYDWLSPTWAEVSTETAISSGKRTDWRSVPSSDRLRDIDMLSQVEALPILGTESLARLLSSASCDLDPLCLLVDWINSVHTCGPKKWTLGRITTGEASVQMMFLRSTLGRNTHTHHTYHAHTPCTHTHHAAHTTHTHTTPHTHKHTHRGWKGAKGETFYSTVNDT